MDEPTEFGAYNIVMLLVEWTKVSSGNFILLLAVPHEQSG